MVYEHFSARYTRIKKKENNSSHDFITDNEIETQKGYNYKAFV